MERTFDKPELIAELQNFFDKLVEGDDNEYDLVVTDYTIDLFNDIMKIVKDNLEVNPIM